jgi:hypothetical protein
VAASVSVVEDTELEATSIAARAASAEGREGITSFRPRRQPDCALTRTTCDTTTHDEGQEDVA